MIERQPDAFERDQAIGELVLDRLELADRLPELLALLGIVDRELKGRPRRAICPRRQREPGREQPIAENATHARSNEACRRADSDEPRYRPQAPIARVGRRARHQDHPARTIASCRFIDGDDEMRAALRQPRRSEASPLGMPVGQPDRARIGGQDRARRTRMRRAPYRRATSRAGRPRLRPATARQRQIGECGRPHRRRARGAAKFRHHHQNLAKAALGRDRSRAQQLPARPAWSISRRSLLAGRRSFGRRFRVPLRGEKPAQGIPEHRS